MKITVNDPNEGRKLVGLIDDEGTLFLRFNDHRLSDQKTVTMNRRCFGDPTTVTVNGTGSLENIISNGRRPLYEGDTITITF